MSPAILDVIECLPTMDYLDALPSVELEGARASTGLSLLCVDLGKQWSNDRPYAPK